MKSVLAQAFMLARNVEQAYKYSCLAVEQFNHIGTWHLKGWCEICLNKTGDAYDNFL